MAEPKRFLATCNDTGAAGALIPVLETIKNDGHEVAVLTKTQAPSRAVFERGEFSPRFTIGPDPSGEAAFAQMISLFKPDVILTSVGTQDDGAEKYALRLAAARGLRTAVVHETWPQHWAATYGERDFPLYRGATRTFVPDDVARNFLIEQGFDQPVLASGSPTHEMLAVLLAERPRIREAFRKQYDLLDSDLVMLWCMNLDIDDPSVMNPEHPEHFGVPEPELVNEFALAVVGVASRKIKVNRVRGVIRRKPDHREYFLRRIVEAAGNQIIIDAQPMGAVAAILGADIVFGTGGTTMLAQAGLCGIPAVHYTPKPTKPDTMITNQIGLTRALRPDTAHGLTDLILDIAADRDVLEELKPKYDAKITPGASRRIANEVLRLCG